MASAGATKEALCEVLSHKDPKKILKGRKEGMREVLGCDYAVLTDYPDSMAIALVNQQSIPW